MTHLRTIEGVGKIAAGKTVSGEVGYEIEEHKVGNMIEADGYITGSAELLRSAAFERGAVLALKGGQTIDIIITHIGPLDELAEIKVSGPIPKDV